MCRGSSICEEDEGSIESWNLVVWEGWRNRGGGKDGEMAGN